MEKSPLDLRTDRHAQWYYIFKHSDLLARTLENLTPIKTVNEHECEELINSNETTNTNSVNTNI